MYGLVCWLNAESAESLAADFRKLAGDFDIEVSDKQNDAVVEEIKACLYRTRCAWLLVFDNVESPSVVQACLPRGGVGKGGHVLITTRRVLDDWRGRYLTLDCFDPPTAAEFLRKAAAPPDGQQVSAPPGPGEVERLAERLGYLPLALAMAAAGLDKGLLSSSLPNLLDMENPYSYKKFQ